MSRKIQIQICIRGNDFLETPVFEWFDCRYLVPLGKQVLRVYDSNECIVARESYVFSYAGRRYGSYSFSTLSDFVSYVNNRCNPTVKKCCVLTYNGCAITLNGKQITYAS